MEYTIILAIAVVVSALVGGLTYWVVKSRAQAMIREAESQAEMIKKEKALQAKEKFIQLKSEHDRAVNERNQKVKEAEQRVRQAEQALQQQQKELDRKVAENDKVKAKMEAQIASLEERKAELAQLMNEQNLRLEQISGMSSEEAKNTLIENMKAEAKSEAAAYINETIEEAKLTATKEAKRIIVASIQRVAPTLKSLYEEYHQLAVQKKQEYAEYNQVKKDMKEYLIAKQTVETILNIDKKKEQEKKEKTVR